MASTLVKAPPGVVVGGGKVGRVVHKLCAPSMPLLGRGDVISDVIKALLPSTPFPIYVATTNDALPAVISQTPRSRREDLVFLQNGMLQPLLAQYGLQDNTQALLYLSASADGSYRDGQRTVATGRWADSMCRLFHAGSLQCRAVEREEYLPLMAEKLLWSCIFWLLSDALGGLPVGVVATQHRPEVEALVEELLPIAQRFLDCELNKRAQQAAGSWQRQAWLPGQEREQERDSPALQQQPQSLSSSGGWERQLAGSVSLDCSAVTSALCQYSLSIPAAVPSKQMALAEFEFRNGWFLGQERTPYHTALLQKVGCLQVYWVG